jgi:hypothetical protein
MYKRYREKHKELRKLYRIQQKERLKKLLEKKQYNDIQFRLRTNLRGRIINALKRQKAIKSKKTLELLGCSCEEARNYLQSKFKEGMTWETHGHKGWHIDHIIPCASFDFTDPEQQKKCFHYTNLQPLWWYENISKGDKILEEYTKDTV